MDIDWNSIQWELFEGADNSIYLPSYLTESYINRQVGKKRLYKIDKDLDF